MCLILISTIRRAFYLFLCVVVRQGAYNENILLMCRVSGCSWSRRLDTPSPCGCLPAKVYRPTCRSDGCRVLRYIQDVCQSCQLSQLLVVSSRPHRRLLTYKCARDTSNTATSTGMRELSLSVMAPVSVFSPSNGGMTPKTLLCSKLCVFVLARLISLDHESRAAAATFDLVHPLERVHSSSFTTTSTPCFFMYSITSARPAVSSSGVIHWLSTPQVPFNCFWSSEGHLIPVLCSIEHHLFAQGFQDCHNPPWWEDGCNRRKLQTQVHHSSLTGPAEETTSSTVSLSECHQSSQRRSGFQLPPAPRASHQIDPAIRCRELLACCLRSN